MQYSDQFGSIASSGMMAGLALKNGLGLDTPTQQAVAGRMTGFAAARRQANAAHKRRVSEAARLYADVLSGRANPILLQEAMAPKTDYIVEHLRREYPGLYLDSNGRMLGLRETMSVTDYQALYVDVLDRMYYGFYSAYPIVNKSLVKMHTLRDFRLVSRYLLDGAVTPFTAMDAAAPPPQRALLGPAPQDGSVPPTFSTSTAPIQYQPLLYQAMTSVNWRAFVNDDLGIFKDLSNRLAIAGNRGISKFITEFFWNSTGPNPVLYQAGYTNLITEAYGAATNNPPLSAQGIMDAMKVLAGMVDSTGDPILINGKITLVYGPALTAAAQNIKKAVNLLLASEGGTLTSAQFPNQVLQVGNWLGDMDLCMDPYMPIVMNNAAGNIAHTAWALVVDPNSQSRPAVEMGMLQGYEVPQIYTKLPNTQRMGGGVDPMLGDFYTMDSDMKIVSVFGGTVIDGRSTVVSTGAGS